MPFKKIRISMLILLPLFLTACQSEKMLISKCWFYTYETNSDTAHPGALTPASFLCLREDGTYTRDFGIFDYGKWSYKENLLILNSLRNQTTALKIQSLKPGDMDVDMGHDQSGHFESQSLPADKASEDPFSLSNNSWRIPAAQKENDAALRKRLIAHCRFWAAYFTWALNSNQQTIDVRSTPTLIKIYGNGFGLKPVEDQPPRWKTYFFDEADCRKAYDIMKKVFDENNIAWAHTDNKYKMFIGAFQQLEAALR